MKRIVLIFCLLLVFTLSACSGKAMPKDPDTNKDKGPSIAESEAQVPRTSSPPATSPENLDDEDQPERALPEGLPVYPGAIFAFDTQVWSGSDDETAWMWMYAEAGSAVEILEFFKTELEKLGFEFEAAFADDYEVFLHDTTGAVSIGYSADENEDLSQLGYMVTVNLDKWDNR